MHKRGPSASVATGLTRLPLTMSALRFNVFGRIFELRREADTWRAFAVGADGKRGPAGFEVPEFIEESELEQFLFDLFHESATPANGEVKRIGP
jgi:hypothetical protein